MVQWKYPNYQFQAALGIQQGVRMVPEIQTAQDIWPQLATIVFVPRTETDYQQLSILRDELKTIVGESENHPLVSLVEVVGALIEKKKG